MQSLPKAPAACASEGVWYPARDLLNSPSFCRQPPHQHANGHWLLAIYRGLEASCDFGHKHFELLLPLNGDSRPTNANWSLNGQLGYPSILEELQSEMHIANSYAGHQVIRYVCLMEEQVLSILQ